MKKNHLTLFAALLAFSFCVTGSHGQSILLAGFDGTNTVSGTSYTDANQDTAAVGNVTASAAVTSGSTAKSLGWGNYAFVFDNSGTVSFTITNTGSSTVTLDRFLFTTYRDNLAGGPPEQVTIAYSAGNLAGSSGVQSLGATQAGSFDFDLGSILTDASLSPGESATFTFTSVPADLSGANRRIKYDGMQFTGTISQPPAGPVNEANSTVTASPTTVLADGSSTSTITVTLKDASGILVAGEDVTLSNPSG
ncbi:MAG: hypothetical protein KJO79_08060, partial [Verrucomicrobiae bacterium]|nr:hypothetical protein [Verrucomicrobiae bacterium]NNJ87119.1 hypothetical protein [Akkermansiaceae bacterium]